MTRDPPMSVTAGGIAALGKKQRTRKSQECHWNTYGREGWERMGIINKIGFLSMMILNIALLVVLFDLNLFIISTRPMLPHSMPCTQCQSFTPKPTLYPRANGFMQAHNDGCLPTCFLTPTKVICVYHTVKKTLFTSVSENNEMKE